jgi:hypothetical protein
MDVVCHEDVSVHGNSVQISLLVQFKEVAHAVPVGCKAGPPVVAALDDVSWRVGDAETAMSGHVLFLL